MVNEKNIVKIADIKLIIDSIFEHLTDDLKIDEVELTEEFYQEVPEAVLYSMGENVTGLTVGSLFDDLEFLRPLVSDRSLATSLMLIHVAPLLRYIAMKVGQ